MTDVTDELVDALVEGLLHEGDLHDHGHTHEHEKSVFTYSFDLPPDLAEDPEYDVLNEASIQRHLAVFAEVAALTGLTFREVKVSDDPDLLFAFRKEVATAYVISHLGGILHVYNPERDTPILGTYTDHLILHELGHGLGLEHGHDVGALPAAFQGHSWTVMSYRAHPNSDSLYYVDSHGPETFMLIDVAALQHLYGANYNSLSGDTIYTVDFDTGEFFIDGEGQSVPNNVEVLRTIWDGGGVDTLDLSNALDGLIIDLRPGAFTSFGSDYLAYQGEGPFGDSLYAPGNLANAYLHDGNRASLLENAIGSRHTDFISGNVADNVLRGGSGDDSLFGLSGNDTLFGDVGDDLIVDGLGDTTAFGGNGDDFIVAFSGEGDLSGGSEDDIILGGIHDDTLMGGDGNDVLRGEAGSGFLFGADTLEGGVGDDLLMGGRGQDEFVFTPDAGNDVIASFLSTDLGIGGASDVNAHGRDFETGVDVIVLRDFVDVTEANVLDFVSASADTDDAYFAAEGTSITFYDVTVDSLQIEDFVFV